MEFERACYTASAEATDVSSQYDILLQQFRQLEEAMSRQEHDATCAEKAIENAHEAVTDCLENTTPPMVTLARKAMRAAHVVIRQTWVMLDSDMFTIDDTEHFLNTCTVFI